MKRKILKMIFIFFTVMLCCTLIARGASSMTVAKVKTEETGRGSLTEEFSGAGKITAKNKIYQSIPEGHKIVDFLVNPGKKVEKGEGILKLDVEELDEKILEQEREISKTELRMEQQKISGNPQARTPAAAQAEIGLNRAKETLAAAQSSYQQAKESYEEAGRTPPSETEEGAVQERLERLREEQDAAWNALQEAQAAYQQSLGEYGLAGQDDANAAANDAAVKQAFQAAQKEMQIDLDIQKEKLEKLKELKEADGIVTAQAEGILESVGAAEGSITTGAEQIVYETGGLEACGVIPGAKLAVVTEKDEIEITIQGEAKKRKLTVERVGQNEEGDYVWYAALSEDSCRSGTDFTYEYRKNSKGLYEQLIPLSALRESGGSYYVLAAEKKPGILGESYEAVRIAVTLVGKDEKHAAVEANLPEKAMLIYESDKYVKEGDRVRINE